MHASCLAGRRAPSRTGSPCGGEAAGRAQWAAAQEQRDQLRESNRSSTCKHSQRVGARNCHAAPFHVMGSADPLRRGRKAPAETGIIVIHSMNRARETPAKSLTATRTCVTVVSHCAVLCERGHRQGPACYPMPAARHRPHGGAACAAVAIAPACESRSRALPPFSGFRRPAGRSRCSRARRRHRAWRDRAGAGQRPRPDGPPHPDCR